MQFIRDQFTVPLGLKVQSKTVLIIIIAYNLNTIEKQRAAPELVVSPLSTSPISLSLSIQNLLRKLKQVSINRRNIIHSKAARTYGEPLWYVPSWCIKPTN